MKKRLNTNAWKEWHNNQKQQLWKDRMRLKPTPKYVKQTAVRTNYRPTRNIYSLRKMVAIRST